ncbi:MAG TPA: hypothetical protein ENK52_06280, partial [Saprospiraceae bacterium]|nr:hypothetical protein [Saprospiraceae bacterium]
MMLKLLSLQWKETIRSAFWEKNLVTNILLGLLALYFALNFLVLGIFLDRILLKIFPDSDPFFIFNRFVLYYLLFDLFMRFMIQQFPTISIQPYLHLPIPKKKLFHYLLIKSIPNFFNWVPFLLIIPFFIKVVVPNYGATQNVVWLLAIAGLILNNNFISYYLKKIFSVKAYVPLIILLGIAVLFY